MHSKEVPNMCVKLADRLRAFSRLINESFYSISFRINLEESKDKAIEVLDMLANVGKNIRDRLNELPRFLSQHSGVKKLKKNLLRLEHICGLENILAEHLKKRGK